MMNGTLCMGGGGGGDALPPNDSRSSSLSGEFAGLLPKMAHSRSAGALVATTTGMGRRGAIIHGHHSDDCCRHRGGGGHYGGLGSMGIVPGGLVPPEMACDNGIMADLGGGVGEGPRGVGGGGEEQEVEEEEEEEEEEEVAWHSLEATPLTDAVTGKKVSQAVRITMRRD